MFGRTVHLVLTIVLRCSAPACIIGMGILSGCASGPPDETSPSVRVPRADDPPNIVLVLTDDQGYGDLSITGHPTIHTPNIDRLATQGCRLTQFYVPSPVCSPTRAALLTGCYPKRVGMHRHVIFPQYDYGLHTDEETIADLLSRRGYATGCFGKWHLGHRPGLLPLDQGFDAYYGVPYSNDMSQFHREPGNRYRYRLPLIEGNEVVAWEPDQRTMSRDSTDRAIEFIDDHVETPFFLYVPFAMPHIPLFASEEFEGRSPRGLYGDVIEEIDHCVGRLVERLEHHDLLENTLIVFLSDNGPWLAFREDGGIAGPLRGGKGTNFEGGQRVPCVVHWPARIAPGSVRRQVSSALDVLPTIAAITGCALPEREIDGRDLGPWLLGDVDRIEEREFLYYSSKGELAGIRRGPWKLLLEEDRLWNVEIDVGERWNRAEGNPEIVGELRARAIALDREITDEARPTRRVEAILFDPSVR